MHTHWKNRSVLAAAAALALSACGGGGSSYGPTSSLQGLAATGAALANAAVTAKCAAGAPLVGTTSTDGSFTLALTGGQTAPCMLQVVGGAPSVTLHGFATEAGRVNVTPLTDLVVTKSLGTDPALAFASYTSSKGDAIISGLTAAKIYVSTQLTSLVGASTASDIMTGLFKVGDADDKLLDSLAVVLKLSGKSQSDLRSGAVQGAPLKPLVSGTPPAGSPPPVVAPPVVTPPVVTPPVTTPPVTTTPVTTPPVVTPPVVTPPASSTNECAPLLPKAGDSLTYQYSTAPNSLAYDTRYDFSSSTYQGQSALAMAVTATINGVTGTSVTYTNPTTGEYLGATASNAATSTVTTFDPPDYQERINKALYTVGQVATVAVKARVSGKGITDAFATIGGGTAITLDYSYTVERKPNETLTVPAGTFANACKLQINVTVSNLQLEGNNGSNPLFASFFPTLSAAFNQPFKSTVWLTNKLPLIGKSFVDTTSTFGAATATQELKAYTLAPR